jgi:hypothetical protein
VAVRELVPISNDWRVRAPSRGTLACMGLCALVLIVAAIDLAHTESRLPDASAPGCPVAGSCFNAELSEQLARDRAADPLQRQYDSRAWLYASAILAIAAIGTAYTLRTSRRREWPRVFTNLGVIGVWLGIGAVIALVAGDGNSVTVPPGPALMLPVVLLVAATAGTLLGRSEGWAETSQADGVRERVLHIGKLAIHIGTVGQARRSRIEEVARWLSNVAIALTALTCLLAIIFVIAQPGGGSCTPPIWTDPIDSVAAVSAIGAMAAGLGTLLLRRWVVALISLAACPVALLLVLASTCFFD